MVCVDVQIPLMSQQHREVICQWLHSCIEHYLVFYYNRLLDGCPALYMLQVYNWMHQCIFKMVYCGQGKHTRPLLPLEHSFLQKLFAFLVSI